MLIKFLLEIKVFFSFFILIYSGTKFCETTKKNEQTKKDIISAQLMYVKVFKMFENKNEY